MLLWAPKGSISQVALHTFTQHSELQYGQEPNHGTRNPPVFLQPAAKQSNSIQIELKGKALQYAPNRSALLPALLEHNYHTLYPSRQTLFL